MIRIRLSISLLLLFLFETAAISQKIAVNLIVHHANIYTVDAAFSKASAMAIKDGKILALGSDDQILQKYHSNEILDAEGNTVLPGLIDAHCHFTGYAADSWKCDLVGTSSFEEVISAMQRYSMQAPMEWLYGRGWDQNDWEVKSFPDNRILDSLFPNRPVFLKRIDGHAALANSKALALANISVRTEIEGGSIEKKNGRLTGLLVDNAMGLVEQVIPPIQDHLEQFYYIKLQRACFAVGLTGVHDCGVSERTIQLLDEVQKKGMLKMKIFALLSDSAHYYETWLKRGPYRTERLHVGGFKLYADGALGSRGACLMKDYSDSVGWKGFLLSKPAHFEQVANLLKNSRFQMCTHAIGDSGNRQILNIYAKVLKGKNDRRWRIEHAQVVDSADFGYFRSNSIIPSVQPTHATSDMYWAKDRLGMERISFAYAYQSLLKTNGWMPLGTDFPVEDISPSKTFLAAVFRKDSKGYPANGFQPANALTREQAIRGMTIWAAKSAFEEKEKGSLEPGKSADFILMNTDWMKCKETEVLKTKILQTFVNGECVHNIAWLDR